MKTLIMLVCMLVAGMCWGGGTSVDLGIRIASETFKCSLCPNSTTYTYTYFEGERLTTHIVFHENLRVKSGAGYLGISLHREDNFSWICPDCLKLIIKSLYKAGKE